MNANKIINLLVRILIIGTAIVPASGVLWIIGLAPIYVPICTISAWVVLLIAVITLFTNQSDETDETKA